MRPCEVLGSQDSVIGPAIWVGALQRRAAVVEEMKPTLSWQVAAVQGEFG